MKVWCLALLLALPASQSFGRNGGFVQPGRALGHWGVGNGGDWLRIGFARAREHAANIVSRLPEAAIATIDDSNTRNWLQKNQQLLAADILTTEHIWYQEAQPTCAWTVPPTDNQPIPTANPVQFSYPACRDRVYSFYEATQLLIHESVHHFGEGETMADKVAIAVVDSWRDGRIEWLPMVERGAPSSRSLHTAVWTGDEMIVFGGRDGSSGSTLDDGGVFDPIKNQWKKITITSGKKRYMHSAHWTGEKMIVWGGYRINGGSAVWRYDGFIYDPRSGEVETIENPGWNPVSSTWAFDPRQQSVWTGDRLIVWGGVDENGDAIGGSYDPITKSWDDLGRRQIDAPQKIAGHSLTFTGKEIIVWGGYEGADGGSRRVTQTGAVYKLAEGQWIDIQTNGQTPSPRAGHQAVWTGSELFIFSGGGVASQRELKSTGGLLNPNTMKWQAVSSEMVIERQGHTTIWNGHEALVYGGKSNRLRTYFSEVYRYDPQSARWQGVNSKTTPESRWQHSAVWTGSSLIIWGGNNGNGRDLRTGGIYYP